MRENLLEIERAFLTNLLDMNEGAKEKSELVSNLIAIEVLACYAS